MISGLHFSCGMDNEPVNNEGRELMDNFILFSMGNTLVSGLYDEGKDRYKPLQNFSWMRLRHSFMK
jgi:hypothetical protein